MTEFTLYLSDTDTDLLFYLKQQQGFNSMTGNQFAEKILTESMHRILRETEKTAARNDRY